MRKALLLVFSLLLVASLLVLCGAVDRDSNSLENIKELDKTIYIGVIEPLTGNNSHGAMHEVLGIRYANSIYNTVVIDGETYNIELIEADNMSTKEGSESAAKSLVDSGVTAVIGSYESANAATSLALFSKNNIPVVGVTCSSPQIENSGNFFRMCFNDTFQSGAIANLAHSMDLKKAAVLTQTGDSYSKAAGKLFEDEFSRLGGKVYNLSFQSGQENYRYIIEEIKNSGADVIFMMSGPYEAKYFIKQARKHGLHCPIMGPQKWDSGLIYSDLSNYYGKVYFTSEFSMDADPVSSEFAQRFSSWLSKDEDRIKINGGCEYTSSASVLAYDAYLLILKAIESSNSTDPKNVMQSIMSISYDGITGNIAFDKKGESGKKIAYVKSINSKEKQFDVIQTISSGK